LGLSHTSPSPKRPDHRPDLEVVHRSSLTASHAPALISRLRADILSSGDGVGRTGGAGRGRAALGAT
jgi:hypothetical protein